MTPATTVGEDPVRARLIPALLVALVAFAAAWVALLPGLAFWDTGELQAVAPLMGPASKVVGAASDAAGVTGLVKDLAPAARKVAGRVVAGRRPLAGVVECDERTAQGRVVLA